MFPKISVNGFYTGRTMSWSDLIQPIKEEEELIGFNQNWPSGVDTPYFTRSSSISKVERGSRLSIHDERFNTTGMG
jgi:hypothetical protein